MGTHCASSMLGSAVSSSTPNDFQPNSHMGVLGSWSADELPCQLGSPEGVRRGRNAEGVGLGNRFAQKVDQRVVDARVLDASGREKKPHGCSFARGVGVVLPSGRLSRGATIIVRRSRRGEIPKYWPSRAARVS